MYQNYSIFGYDLSNPGYSHVLSKQYEKIKAFVKDDELPQNPMDKTEGIDPVCILKSDMRPIELNIRHNLPWYETYIHSLKTSDYPPLYIIEQISHLRICCSEIFRANASEFVGTFAWSKLLPFFPGQSNNPIPSIIGNYLLTANKKYTEKTKDRRHSGLLHIKDKWPGFVKALVFQMVFWLVYLIRSNLFRNRFFNNFQEVLVMTGVPRLNTRKRSRSCFMSL